MKSIFITGAASGIGRATALLFAENGWFVGLYDINTEALAETAAQCPNSCHAVMDVTKPESVQAALAHFAEATDGRMDILFNCAGILAVDAFEAVPLEQHHRIIDINVKGLISVSHLALPLLQASKAQGGEPQVINMSSASAIYGPPDFASYGASKFAVRGLTEALNLEWQRHGILVRDVMPLFVKTAMVEGKKTEGHIDRLGINISAEDVANKVWRLSKHRRGSVHWPVGVQTHVLAILSKLSPAFLNRFVQKLLSNY